MSCFDTYRASFPNARLTRSKSGVLEVAFHTDGGTLVFDGHMLADIVLATPSTVFQDKPHFEFGVVPGDGVHLLWQEAIGT